MKQFSLTCNRKTHKTQNSWTQSTKSCQQLKEKYFRSTEKTMPNSFFPFHLIIRQWHRSGSWIQQMLTMHLEIECACLCGCILYSVLSEYNEYIFFDYRLFLLVFTSIECIGYEHLKMEGVSHIYIYIQHWAQQLDEQLCVNDCFLFEIGLWIAVRTAHCACTKNK